MTHDDDAVKEKSNGLQATLLGETKASVCWPIAGQEMRFQRSVRGRAEDWGCLGSGGTSKNIDKNVTQTARTSSERGHATQLKKKGTV